MAPFNLIFLRKMPLAYDKLCKPLCREIGMPQTAFDILMFLGNHPQYRTASDIVSVRGIKANLVSVNVDKLVKEGFLERHPTEDDRRKLILTVTDKARPVLKQGRRLQRMFFSQLFDGIDEESLQLFASVIARTEANLDGMLKESEEE